MKNSIADNYLGLAQRQVKQSRLAYARDSVVKWYNRVLLPTGIITVCCSAIIYLNNIIVNSLYFILIIVLMAVSSGLVVLCRNYIKAVNTVYVLSLIDRVTNEHNVIVNSYELAMGGCQSVFARMTIDKGLAILGRNMDLQLAFDNVRISKNKVALAVFLIIGSCLIVELAGNKNSELYNIDNMYSVEYDHSNVDNSLLLESDRYNTFIDNEKFSYSRSNAQDVYEAASADNMPDRRILNGNRKHSFASETEIANPVTTSAGNSLLMPEIDVTSGLLEYLTDSAEAELAEAARQVHIENEKQDAVVGFGQVHSSQVKSNNLVTGGIGGVNSELSQNPVNSNALTGRIAVAPEAYLIDRFRDPIREIGFFPESSSNNIGFGLFGTDKRTRSKSLVVMSDIIPLFIKGIRQDGRNKVYNISLPSGAAGVDHKIIPDNVEQYHGNIDRYDLPDRWKASVLNFYSEIH